MLFETNIKSNRYYNNCIDIFNSLFFAIIASIKLIQFVFDGTAGEWSHFPSPLIVELRVVLGHS